MLLLLTGALVLGCATADDAEWMGPKSGVKGGVKGGRWGGGSYNPYYPGTNTNRQDAYGGYVTRFNMTQQNTTQHGSSYDRTKEFREVGVCYIEVATASLARDPAHIPAGNGSRPDLSRIRTCCKGYERNIELFLVCDPVCTPECVNAICTAPNTCSCFPDHIRNLGGFCMPTCPIGCQNGYCSGGECLCKDGYTLDSDGKFCKPVCRENCGGIAGNCTQPNTCTCKTGYQATPEGNCKPACSNQCRNGDCIAPNECRCKPGYKQVTQGLCEPECPQGCPNGHCIAPNVCNTASTTLRPASIPPYYPTNQPNKPLYPDSLVQNGTANPNQTHPGQTYPGQTYPGQRYPGQTYPDQRYPGQTYPGQYPVQRYPGQINPGDTYPGQTNPNQRYPGQTYPGQQNPSQIYPGQQGNGYTQDISRNPLYTDSQVSGQHGETSHSGQSGYQGQTGYQGQSGHQGQSGYQGQTYDQGQSGYHGQSAYDSQSGYQEQSGYNRQTEYQGQSGYQSQSGQHGQSGYQESTGQAGYYGQRPRYPSQPDSQSQLYPGYPDQRPVNPDGQYECSSQCFNGVCIEGDTCRCNPGYVTDPNDQTGSRCIPYCPGGCPNGSCSSPHFCICNAGYHKDTSVKGRPACVKRIRRSAEEKTPGDIASLLVFDIPDY